MGSPSMMQASGFLVCSPSSKVPAGGSSAPIAANRVSTGSRTSVGSDASFVTARSTRSSCSSSSCSSNDSSPAEKRQKAAVPDVSNGSAQGGERRRGFSSAFAHKPRSRRLQQRHSICVGSLDQYNGSRNDSVSSSVEADGASGSTARAGTDLCQTNPARERAVQPDQSSFADFWNRFEQTKTRRDAELKKLSPPRKTREKRLRAVFTDGCDAKGCPWAPRKPWKDSPVWRGVSDRQVLLCGPDRHIKCRGRGELVEVVVHVL